MSGRTLVTGAAGFVGRHLVPAVLAQGSPVVALCRRPDALADLAHPALSVVAGDIRDPAARARALAGADTVFHLAAARNRPGTSPGEMAAVNEDATLRLAREAAAAGVRRFVHLSTALVFGPSAIPLEESAPLYDGGREGAYAASKARAVAELRQLARAGAPVAILHPTIVYGPDHPSRPNRVTAHIRRLLRRRFDIVVDGGRARRDLVHVADLVAALLAAAVVPSAVGQEFLVAGESVSQRGLGELVARSASRPRPLVVSLPVAPSRIAARLVDRLRGYDPSCGFASALEALVREWNFRASRAREILDYRPRSLAEGVAQTVAWIREGVHER